MNSKWLTCRRESALMIRILFVVWFIVIFDAVQSIAQPCTQYPGYTTWLGYTDAWEDSSNWCPPIAPTNANASMNIRIPGGPSGPYTYYRPVIHPGVYALTEKLRVETGDTLYIEAGTLSSLTVNDSLKIQNSNSAIVVNQTAVDSVQLSGGNVHLPNDVPFNNYNRSRSFLVIPQTELIAQGLQAGDAICRILFHIQRNSNGNPYRNCTIRYYHTSNVSGNFGTGYTANIPVPTGPVITIWSGDLFTSDYISVMNDYGTVDLELQTPLVWSGSSSPVVIEICYDNFGFNATGFNDEPRFTQTGNFNRYLCIQALTGYSKPGCELSPKDTIVVNGSWVAGSNIITFSSAAQIANVLPGMISYQDGLSVISIAGSSLIMSGLFTTSNTNSNIVLSNVKVISGNFRPNMTFVKNCQNQTKYPIYVRGHWENNGTFVAGYSRVIFDGVVSDQQISGQSKTIFYDLDISNPNHVIRGTDFTVMDSLRLLNGNLKLNLGMMTLAKPHASAMTRTSGFIQCETDQVTSNQYPFGRIFWKMGSVPGLYIFPFINHAGQFVPLDYQVVSGVHHVVAGTYGTFPDNTSLPLPEVTNVIGFNGVSYDSSGALAVDRFFLIKDSLGISPIADVVLRYANSERAAINPAGVSVMGAQQWNNALNLWENPLLPGQVYSTGVPDQVSVTISDAVFGASDWWTVSLFSNPLGTGLTDTGNATFSVYPNPVSNGTTLNIMSQLPSWQPTAIRIFSAEGLEVINEKFNGLNPVFKIPDYFSSGVYIMQLHDNLKSAWGKLVIINR